MPTFPSLASGAALHVEVHFDDLDPLGMLYFARYATVVDRAMAGYWLSRGYRYDHEGTHPDAVQVTRQYSITYEQPVHRAGRVVVHFWLEGTGRTSITYGFRLLSEDGLVEHAHGRRTNVKIDPITRRPSEWTPAARREFERLLGRADDESNGSHGKTNSAYGSLGP